MYQVDKLKLHLIYNQQLPCIKKEKASIEIDINFNNSRVGFFATQYMYTPNDTINIGCNNYIPQLSSLSCKNAIDLIQDKSKAVKIKINGLQLPFKVYQQDGDILVIAVSTASFAVATTIICIVLFIVPNCVGHQWCTKLCKYYGFLEGERGRSEEPTFFK